MATIAHHGIAGFADLVSAESLEAASPYDFDRADQREQQHFVRIEIATRCPAIKR